VLALASGTFNGPARRGEPPPSVAPPPALTLTQPDPAVTREQTVDIAGVLPADLDRSTADQLRVYVNARVVRERDIPGEDNFTINGIPLEEGTNEISAALVGSGGEGELSAPVSVDRDSTAPEISISSPEPGAMVYSATATLRGRTEPGATIEVKEEGFGGPVPATVSDDGRFQATMGLALGANSFVLHSTDPAGNVGSTRFEVTRATSLASVALTVSTEVVALSDLPATVGVVATVHDELGRAADGVAVTFSLSPPNRGTSTYRATTANGGRASWPNMVVTGDERAAGAWLVTALATLPSGQELRGSGSFSVQ
jgi:Glucodextranase, domain B